MLITRKHCVLITIMLSFASPALGQVVWHDAQLNWDFINFGNQTADNFEITVSADRWRPPGYPGSGWFGDPFSTLDLGPDPSGSGTLARWSGGQVAPGQTAHVGLNMQGSGKIVNAFWTFGPQGGDPLPIVFERTRITRRPGGRALVDMSLETTNAFVATGSAELREIRTFMNIPSDMLGLADLNQDLFQRFPQVLQFETQPSQTSLVLSDQPSFVNVGETTLIGPEWESLLVADVFLLGPQPRLIGRFWNLNPQSPAPGTMLLITGGALMTLRRRRCT